eukprot:1526673-Pyramimonas_sp.AAC.1
MRTFCGALRPQRHRILDAQLRPAPRAQPHSGVRGPWRTSGSGGAMGDPGTEGHRVQVPNSCNKGEEIRSLAAD